MTTWSTYNRLQSGLDDDWNGRGPQHQRHQTGPACFLDETSDGGAPRRSSDSGAARVSNSGARVSSNGAAPGSTSGVLAGNRGNTAPGCGASATSPPSAAGASHPAVAGSPAPSPAPAPAFDIDELLGSPTTRSQDGTASAPAAARSAAPRHVSSTPAMGNLISFGDDEHDSDDDPWGLPRPRRSGSRPAPSGGHRGAGAGDAPGAAGTASASTQQQSSHQDELLPGLASTSAAGPQAPSGTISDWLDEMNGDARRGGDASAAGPSGAEDGQEGDEAGGQRELLIYAIPLFKDDIVFLPVTMWKDVAGPRKGLGSKVAGKVEALQDKATGMWQSMGEKDPSTFQNKVYKVGQRIVEDMSPEERLARSIPKRVTKVVVWHPTTIPPDVIMEKMTKTNATHKAKSLGKAVAATLMLPIAFGIDIILIPGPQILTYYALFEIYRNSSSATGSARLTKYIAQEGTEERVRVNYAAEPRLDIYCEKSREHPDGVLEEEDLEALCEQLGEPSLLHPLTMLRERYVRQHTKKKFGSDYQQLSTQARY